jgi:hypothetical protein
VKYNYSATDLSVLVEVIAMIKGLTGVMHREVAFILPIISRAIYFEIQEFLQLILRGNFICFFHHLLMKFGFF